MIKAIVEDFGNGGTIDGDLVVSGDLQVSGGGSLSFDEIVSGTQVVEITNTEALLVRKASDGGDVFIVDTTNSRVGVGIAPTVDLDISSPSGDVQARLFRNANVKTSLTFKNSLQEWEIGNSVGDNNKFTIRDITDSRNAFVIDGSGDASFSGTATVSGGILTLGTADTSSGHINAFENMSFNIDTDNDDTNRFFEFSINGSSGSGTELMRLAESGVLSLKSGRLRLSDNETDNTNKESHIISSQYDTDESEGYMAMRIASNSADNHVSIGGGHADVNASTLIRFFTASNKTTRTGTERMRITSGGLLGIGTGSDTIDAPLHVKGGTANTAKFQSASGATNILLSDSSDSLVGQMEFGASASQIVTRTSSTLSLGSNNVKTLHITDDDRVGIGTNTAEAKVHTKQTSSDYAMFIQNSTNVANHGNGLFITSVPEDTGSYPLFIKTNHSGLTEGDGNVRFVVRGDGNIGVGTASPSQLLHIKNSGVGHAHANIESTDNTYVSFLQLSTNGNNWQIAAGGSSHSTFADSFYIYDTTNSRSIFRLDANSRISLSNNDGGADNTVYGKLAGNALTTNGDENVLIGHEAGNDMNTGERNVCVGYQSGDKLTSGNRSVAIGYGSLGSEQTGARSIAIGFNCLSQQNVGANTYNTAVGVEAGFYNRTGTANTFLGYNSGKGASEQSNSSNVGVGYHSLLNVTTGSNNTAVGKDAMLNVTTGSYNVAIGNIAMDSATTGGTNVAIGSRALATSQAPLYNVAVGADALFGIPAGEAITGAVAIGTEAFKGDSNSTTGANYTVAIGQEALKYLQTGSDNVAIGYQSQDANTTGSQNVSLGRGSLSGTVDGVSNTAIGAYAMSTGDVGTSNTAVGSQSMTDSTGSYNTALGMQSLFDCVAGGSNTVVGALAMKFSNGGESSNVAIGVEAMRDVKENGNTADSNIAIGVLSMKGGTLGGDFIGNIAIGDRAMDSTDTNAQTGTVAIGHHSLTALTSGAGNTAVGYQSLKSVDDGSKCTAVGYQAGNTTEGATKSTFIGYDTEGSGANVNNETVIGADAVGQGGNTVTLGNSDVTKVYVAPGNTSGQTITFKDNSAESGFIQYDHSNDQMKFGTGGSINLRLNSDGELVTTKGINFPDSQNASSDANTLDDYEEGTFTPTITVATGSAGLNASFSAGEYTKIGNLVTAIYKIRIGTRSTSPAPSGALDIALPFTSGSGSGTNTSSGTGSLIGEFNGDTDGTLIALASSDHASILRDTDGNFNNDCGQFLPAVGGYIHFSVQYTVD